MLLGVDLVFAAHAVFPAGPSSRDQVRLPYGLERLASLLPDVDVRSRRLSAARRYSIYLPNWGLGSARFGPEPRVQVTWDEFTASAARGTAPRNSPKLTGLIWATDDPRSVVERVRFASAWASIRSSDHVWCLSHAQTDLVQRKLGPGGPRVSAVPFGIDIDRFRPSGGSPGSKLVVSLGNDRDRDTWTLVRALQQVRLRDPEIVGVIQARQRMPSGPGITFVRRLPQREVVQLLDEAMLVAIATRENNHISGMTVALEGAAMSKPVIMSRTTGADEYVVSGKTGILVPPNRPDSMASAIMDLAEDEKVRLDMGRAARRLVEERHSLDSLARSVANLVSIYV